MLNSVNTLHLSLACYHFIYDPLTFENHKKEDGWHTDNYLSQTSHILAHRLGPSVDLCIMYGGTNQQSVGADPGS